MSVELKVKQVIYDHLYTYLDEDEIGGAGDITAEMSLADLGADSLDHIEIVLDIEREFDVAVDDMEATNWNTVGDVIKTLSECEGL